LTWSCFVNLTKVNPYLKLLWWIAGQQWVMFAAMVAAFGVWAWRRYRRERAKESIWDRAKDKR
jgi:ABC-type multidrug transport system permease subunit